MLHSGSEILAETTNTPVKTFSIAFFLNLYYTFITHDGRKSNQQREKINEQRAKSNEKRAKSNKERAKINEKRAKTNKQRAKSSEQWPTGKTFSLRFILLYAIKLQCALLMKIKEILKNDGITTYPYRTNLLFLKYFEEQDTPNSIEELKNVYKEFTENDKLW